MKKATEVSINYNFKGIHTLTEKYSLILTCFETRSGVTMKSFCIMQVFDIYLVRNGFVMIMSSSIISIRNFKKTLNLIFSFKEDMMRLTNKAIDFQRTVG